MSCRHRGWVVASSIVGHGEAAVEVWPAGRHFAGGGGVGGWPPFWRPRWAGRRCWEGQMSSGLGALVLQTGTMIGLFLFVAWWGDISPIPAVGAPRHSTLVTVPALGSSGGPGFPVGDKCRTGPCRRVAPLQPGIVSRRVAPRWP